MQLNENQNPFAGATSADFEVVGHGNGIPESVAEPTPTPAPEPTPEPDKDQVTQPEPPPVTSEPPIQAAPSSPAKTWKEILAESEFDEFAIRALEHYKATGNLDAYVDVARVDYNKLSEAEILRRAYDKKYSKLGLTAKEIDAVYHRDMSERYKYDFDNEQGYAEDETDTDIILGRALLKAETKTYRDEFIEEQRNFVAPQREAAAEEPEISIEKQKEFYASQPVMKSILQSKVVEIPISKDAKFKFAVADPQALIDVMVDPDAYASVAFTKDASGKQVPNLELLSMVSSLMIDPKGFISGIYNLGRSHGTEKVVAEADNVTSPTSVNPPGENESLWKAFARRGVNKVGE
jgi:hypothetical protein